MTRSKANKLKNRRTGLRAEMMAALYLRLKLYRIIARNWRSKAGEIDLIATRGKTLAFIEVKARSTNEEGRYALQPRQQARIARAAEAFLAMRPEYATMHIRFDLMVVAPFRVPDHIAGAWGYD